MKISTLTPTTLTRALQRGNDTDESPQAKRWREMRDSLQQLKAMNDPKRTAREDKERRAAQLKQRLESLKALLLHASPQQAKALLGELKSIAKELASLVKSGGGGGGAASPTVQVAGGDTAACAEAASSAATAADTVEAPSDIAAADGGDEAAASAEAGAAKDAAAETAEDSSDSDGTTPTRDEEKRQQRSEAAGGDDKSLSKLLEELKRLLKEVTHMMKARLAAGDQEARDELRRIEKEVRDIGAPAAADTAGALYTGLGAVASGLSLDAGAAPTGTTVSTSA